MGYYRVINVLPEARASAIERADSLYHSDLLNYLDVQGEGDVSGGMQDFGWGILGQVAKAFDQDVRQGHGDASSGGALRSALTELLHYNSDWSFESVNYSDKVSRYIDTRRAGKCDKAVKIQTDEDIIWLRNWERAAVARTHDARSGCESLWTLECNSEKLVETRFCPFEFPNVSEFCMPSWRCPKFHNFIDHPENGTMWLRLPGKDQWTLADAGSSIKIVVSSAGAPPGQGVIDGDGPFAGRLGPWKDMILTYNLRNFTKTMLYYVCDLGPHDPDCKSVVAQTLRSLDVTRIMSRLGLRDSIEGMPVRLVAAEDTASVSLMFGTEIWSGYMKSFIAERVGWFFHSVLEDATVWMFTEHETIGAYVKLYLSDDVRIKAGER